MAKTAQAGLPLSPALIDSVTHQDHDHLLLLNKVNSTLQTHENTLTTQQAQITDHATLIKQLQEQVAALQPKTA